MDGNLTSDGLWTYSWDGENRLKSMYMSGLNAGAPRLKVDFVYDFMGRRVRKTVSARADDVSAWVGSTDVVSVYDGWRLMAEKNVTGGTVVRSYVWGTDLSGGWEGAGGIGGALGFRTAASGLVHAYAYDGNGNVLGTKDATTLTWSSRYEYGPFGEVIRRMGTAAMTNPFRFSTKYQDDESELLYYGYRFYNAATGRWLSRDPIQERGGLNLYGFVKNRPIANRDRLGLSGDFGPPSTINGQVNVTYYDDTVNDETVDDGEREILLNSVRTLESCACKVVDTYLKAHLYRATTFQWAMNYVDGRQNGGWFRGNLTSRGYYKNLGRRQHVASIRLGATADNCPSAVIYNAEAPYFPGYAEQSDFE